MDIAQSKWPFKWNIAFYSEEEGKAYLEETKCTSNLEKIIVQGYKALGLQYYFTAGPDEVKAWTIQKGTKAPQAAGRIHGDFEKGSWFNSLLHKQLCFFSKFPFF